MEAYQDVPSKDDPRLQAPHSLMGVNKDGAKGISLRGLGRWGVESRTNSKLRSIGRAPSAVNGGPPTKKRHQLHGGMARRTLRLFHLKGKVSFRVIKRPPRYGGKKKSRHPENTPLPIE